MIHTNSEQSIPIKITLKLTLITPAEHVLLKDYWGINTIWYVSTGHILVCIMFQICGPTDITWNLEHFPKPVIFIQ